MRLAQFQQMETATMLIQRKMRISIVASITHIHAKPLRTLYREIHGHGPVAGQLPSSGGILSTRTQQATASIFAALYLRASQSNVGDQINLEALLSAHDLYLEVCSNQIRSNLKVEPINITQAWIIVRDISIGAAYFRSCQSCQIRYLLSNDTHIPPTCPICALKKRHS